MKNKKPTFEIEVGRRSRKRRMRLQRLNRNPARAVTWLPVKAIRLASREDGAGYIGNVFWRLIKGWVRAVRRRS
jgi:hypothetical protein